MPFFWASHFWAFHFSVQCKNDMGVLDDVEQLLQRLPRCRQNGPAGLENADLRRFGNVSNGSGVGYGGVK